MRKDYSDRKYIAARMSRQSLKDFDVVGLARRLLNHLVHLRAEPVGLFVSRERPTSLSTSTMDFRAAQER